MENLRAYFRGLGLRATEKMDKNLLCTGGYNCNGKAMQGPRNFEKTMANSRVITNVGDDWSQWL